MAAGALAALSLAGIAFCFAWAWRKVRFYARRDTPLPYLLLVGGVWWLGVVAVGVLLPMDVATTSKASASSKAMLALWKTNYWVTFICCWVICPIASEYWTSGAFTRKRRLRSALLFNLKFYARVLAALALVFVLVLLRQGFQISKVTGFLIAAANAYGLFLLVVMLGYGLVELPREIWEKTCPRRMLDYYYCSAAQTEETLMDAQADLMDVLDGVDRFECPQDLLLQAHYDEVRAKAKNARETCLDERPTILQRGRRTSLDSTGGRSSLVVLEELHYRLKKATITAERAKYQWQALLDVTEQLEAEVKLIETGTSSLYQRLDSGGLEAGMEAGSGADGAGMAEEAASADARGPPRKLVLYYKALKGLYAVMVLLSLVLIWNECASAISSEASVFGIMVHSSNSLFTRWLCCVLPLSYIAACVYVALFKFKLLDQLTLYGNRQTDVSNLLFNASYMGRVQFSLGVNYTTQLVAEDRQSLAFYSLVGDMDVVPFLGSAFNFYLPVLIVLLAACTYFRVLDRVLNMVGIETHTEPGEGGQNQDLVSQGRQLVTRYRARLERRRGRNAENAEERSFSLREF